MNPDLSVAEGAMVFSSEEESGSKGRYLSSILTVEQGRGNRPFGIVLVEPASLTEVMRRLQLALPQHLPIFRN